MAYISIIDHALGKILTEISEGPKEIDMENWELTLDKERLDEINVKVHGCLRMKFKKNAKIWLKTRPKNIGLQTWKAMMDKYDPMSGASKLDLHRNIHIMRRVKHIRDATGAIEDWEVRYNLYKQRTGKELDDETQQNIILGAIPEKDEIQLRSNLRGRQMVPTYAVLRQEMFDCVHALTGRRDGMHIDIFDREERKAPRPPA